jgi:hypothetical protein
MSKGPIALVKEQFGDKKKLVEALQKLTGDDLWLGRTSKTKGASGLAHVSNAKLLKLHATFGAVKEKFGTRAKLVDAVLEIEKRAKDEGYKTRLEGFPVPRLWDMFKSAEKRSGAKAAKAAGTKTAKTAQAGVAVQAKAAKKSAGHAAKKTAAKKTSAPAKKGAKKSSGKKSGK